MRVKESGKALNGFNYPILEQLGLLKGFFLKANRAQHSRARYSSS
jgi:hypothetical protein